MEYIYFKFDNISSQKYNLIVQNRGEDLIYPSQPNFDNQIVSPLYQGTSYLAGVNKKERVFNFNCWVASINTDTLRVLNRWLSPEKVGDLILDYNPNFKYIVKVNSISEFKHLSINDDGTSNYEFSLSFITIGDATGVSIDTYTFDDTNYSANVIGPNRDNGGPIAFRDDEVFKFLNYYSEPVYFDILMKGATAFDISVDGTEYYSFTSDPAQVFKIDSEFGIVTIGEEFAELTEGVQAITNLGPMSIPSGEAVSLISDVDFFYIDEIVINDPKGKIEYSAAELQKDNIYIIVQDGSYGDNSTNFLDIIADSLLSTKINKDGTNSDIGVLHFDTSATTILTRSGDIGWNQEDGTLDVKLLNGATLQLGQETYFYGKATESIPNGYAVQFAGTEGDVLLFKKAVYSEIVENPDLFFGISTQDLETNQVGYITYFGKVRDLDTQDWEDEELLYLCTQSPGCVVSTKPVDQQINIIVGFVVKTKTGLANNGVIFSNARNISTSVEPILVTLATEKTLLAANWTGTESPYEYTLPVEGVLTSSLQTITPSLSVTPAQLEEMQLANIQDGGQATGEITLKAFGKKPTNNLPVRILITKIT